MLRRRYAAPPAFLLALLYATSATALSFTLQVLDGGSPVGSMNQVAMNCTGTAPNFSCSGMGAALGDLGIDTWNFSLDEDPLVSGTTAVTNSSGLTKHFTMIFTLLLAAPVTPSSVIGGSMQGGATDNTGNGVTLASFGGSSLYAAQIDGTTVQTLYNDPQSFSAGNFLSVNVPQASFGTPIPSQPSVAALNSIGIVFDFTLTPGDSASFTGVFVAVPEPGTVLLLGMGVAGLALAAGRRRGSLPD